MSRVAGYLLIFAVLCLSYRAYEIGQVLRQMHHEQQAVRIMRSERGSLPKSCEHLLNLGTWEWADCMLVGRK